MRHVEELAEDAREAQEVGTKPRDTHFEISIAANVDSAIFRFGSALSFTNPLVQAEFSYVSLNVSTLLSSQSLWFVPEVKGEGSDEDMFTEHCDQNESDGNQLLFASELRVHYLNTKHNHLECLIEQYPCFMQMAYKTFFQEALLYYGEDPETSTFVVNVNCPRFLSINALPSFFETLSMLAKIAAQLDPESYQTMVLNRYIVGEDTNARGNSVGCYFIGCQEIHVKNCTGRELKVGLAASDYTSINPDDAASVSLSNTPTSQTQLSFAIDKYKLIRNFTVSPYQSLMLPLFRNRKTPGIKRQRKGFNSASGFSPHLTVVPQADSLDSIALSVRTCVTIQTDIRIRYVEYCFDPTLTVQIVYF